MDGNGILHVIDRLGHTIAAQQQEIEQFKAQVAALTEAVGRRTEVPSPEVLQEFRRRMEEPATADGS